MIRIGLVGYTGRMGQLIAQSIQEGKDFVLSSIYKRDVSKLQVDGACVTDSWQEFLHHCEVVIDFSNHQASEKLLREMNVCPKPLVIGTTGLSAETHLWMKELAEKIPIVYTTNTSRGVALLNQLSFWVSQVLKDSDIEIVELHHRHKKDAPSGTAMTLAQECARARGLRLEDVRISGRDGNIGERNENEIGVLSLRGGDIVGKHTIGFYCDGEYLELTHNATSRKTFAIGALEAAKWVINQKHGLYSMKDVLSL